LDYGDFGCFDGAATRADAVKAGEQRCDHHCRPGRGHAPVFLKIICLKSSRLEKTRRTEVRRA
jgi:hypothetical protein